MNTEMKKKIEELIADALEYDVLTEDEDLGGIMFEDELVGKNSSELLNLLMADRELLSKIEEALREAKADEDEEDEESEEDEEGEDNE
ncbi:hypothetical protein [Alphaproteobacteria bacterium endosymbiont of Tiliacea citrago]|uniref:hypothetical protein n=1 Tax=Alphaproteobacteria bacterium endosymbiont of Tiliacea citrago TaxID=3077944 RepID=UPI00313D26AB